MDTQNNHNQRQRQNPINQSISLFDRILKQKIRFQNQFEDQQPLIDIPAQINRSSKQYIYGVVENFRICINKQKKDYGLQDSGKCYQFTLNGEYLIVIASQLNSLYPNNTPISLYLPISMTIQPKLMIGDKQIVIIRPFQNNEDQNLMLYPYVIVEPTQYVDPTYICHWLQCKRLVSIKQYLKQKFRIEKILVLGNACHKFLQHLLDNLVTVQNKRFQHFEPTLRKIYDSFLYQFYVVRKQQQIIIDFEQFLKLCRKSLTNIHKWVFNHIIYQIPIEDGMHPNISLKITEVIGSQTMHKSKYFGLKGKTDGLFKGLQLDKKKNTETVVFIPFQLKTGAKVSDSHKSQLDIYNILLRQKENKPTIGILYYSENDMTILRPQRADLAFSKIVMNRNTVLLDLNRLFLKQQIRLPHFTFAGSPCKVCKITENCEIFFINEKLQQMGRNYYKKKFLHPNLNVQNNNLNDQENNEQRRQMLKILDQMDEQEQNNKQKTPSDENKKAKNRIQDLKYSEIKYIQRWMKCLHAEERETRISKLNKQKNRWNIFTLQSSQLLKIKEFFSVVRRDEQRMRLAIQKRIHSLQQFEALKDSFKGSQKIRINITYLGIEQNCKIISTKRQSSIFYLNVEFTNKQIIYSNCYLERGIRYNVMCDVQAESYDNLRFSSLRNTVFEFATGTNEDLKELVIEEYQARRDINSEQKQLSSISKVKVSAQDCKPFNKFQQIAFRKTFSDEYCTLVEGMPGTGKTELIVKIIQKCYKQDLKVLITTFTNRSLDNIIDRTLKSKVVQDKYIIRQGSKQGLDSKFLKYNSSSQQFTDIFQYKSYFDNKMLWFVTLASVSSPHIPKDFDLVILDEASQSLQPACIEALGRGTKIVLIGDYKQLQPIVKSRKAISQKMNISLFQKLCRSRGQSVVSLCFQYRMNKEIMKLSNTLVYGGLLQPDSQQREGKKIELCQNWMSQCRISQVVDIINPDNPVVFLNHDNFLGSMSRRNSNQKGQITHILEIELAIFLFKKLLQLKVKSQDIAIVCVYNKTVDEIKSYFQKNQIVEQGSQRLLRDKEQSQVLTIDKSQGIDKEAIILLAESRQIQNNILLEDRRRLNVALTRAKTKLIIIGSMNYLQQQNSVFDGRLPGLLRNKCEYSVDNQLVNHVINSMN